MDESLRLGRVEILTGDRVNGAAVSEQRMDLDWAAFIFVGEGVGKPD